MLGNMPCTRDCQGRTGTCHDTCEPFLEWKQGIIDKKQALRREIRNQAQVMDIHAGAVRKSKGGRR